MSMSRVEVQLMQTLGTRLRLAWGCGELSDLLLLENWKTSSCLGDAAGSE